MCVPRSAQRKFRRANVFGRIGGAIKASRPTLADNLTAIPSFKARTAIAWLRAENSPQLGSRFELETRCSEFIRKELKPPQRPLTTSALNNDDAICLYLDARPIVNFLRLDKRHCSGIGAHRYHQDCLFILLRSPATADKCPAIAARHLF